MIPMIYIIMLVGWGLMMLGFIRKEYVFLSLSSMLLVCLGVYMAINGLTGITNIATQALALAHWGVGVYVFIRSSYEIYQSKL